MSGSCREIDEIVTNMTKVFSTFRDSLLAAVDSLNMSNSVLQIDIRYSYESQENKRVVREREKKDRWSGRKHMKVVKVKNKQ